MWFVVILCLSFGVHAAEEGVDDLIQKGQTHLQQGQYHLALDELASAGEVPAEPDRRAQVLGLLGVTHYQMRHFETADALLQQALGIERNAKNRARWLAAFADSQAKQGKPEQAERWYKEAAQAGAGDAKLTLSIKLAQIALMPQEQRLAKLQALSPTLQELDNTDDRARYAVNIATQALGLGAAGVKLAHDSFEQARLLAGNARVRAEALGGLAQLYEDRQRFEEAMRLNRLAIDAVRQVDASDLLLNLEWRQGRLHRALRQIPDALLAYQRAVEHIEAIRQDIPVEYNNGSSSFRETLEPVYLGLADMLLQQAAKRGDADKLPLLHRARETVELIKQSEVEDFLGGRCGVRATKSALEWVEPKTAVIYPVMLPDRLELLVSVGSELRQYTQAVSAATLQGVARTMAHDLRTGGSFKIPAQSLYRWLVAPLETLLQQHQIQTLVIVPDGALRLIPMAALHDGKHYLIEKYAFATSPGLTLFNPSPLHLQRNKTLLAGISQPGGGVERLPSIFLDALSGDIQHGVNANATVEDRNADWQRLRNDSVFRKKLQDKLSLPGVNQELGGLKNEVPNTLLMNENFTVDSFRQHLSAEPYSVIHIASHGVFGKKAASSFIMTYDDVININELEGLLKSEKFKKQPIELLILSACQTAEGNDLMPLGLAGVALKANVRTALGTLWPVSDDAAAKLMVAFYKALSQPNINKAQALQQAQISLLKQPELEHPYYWAPFIVVGNWL